jgi:hypothetical protein
MKAADEDESGLCARQTKGSTKTEGWIQERERWVLLKLPRCDIDGVGEVK